MMSLDRNLNNWQVLIRSAIRFLPNMIGAPTTTQRLTLTWDDPNEWYLGSTATLTLPPPINPGTYQLLVGLYDFQNGQRLHTAAGKDNATILIQIGLNQDGQTF